MRDSFFNGQRQKMVFPARYPVKQLRGKAKGIKQVLQERGLWEDGLLKTCDSCKTGKKDPEQLRYYAQRILELQPDFLAQKSLLAEIAESEGHKIIFYPKFYCEFNFIEMFWSRVKAYAHEKCDYSFSGLQKTVPLALESVDLELIHKYAKRSFRYMDAYRIGLTSKDLERQVKKYKSHRTIPENWATLALE
jgi:hypothetical protein